MTSAPQVSVRLYTAAQASEWKAFLKASNNGTLYHDLDFLAYHKPGKFQEHHLMFYLEDKLVALLPAAIVAENDGRKMLKSPYGASVGGLVLPQKLTTEQILLLVKALQAYARELGLVGLDIKLPPSVYAHRADDLQSFALMVNGFGLTGRALQYIMPLGKEALESGSMFSTSKRYDIRKGLKTGLVPREEGIAHLEDFYALMDNTYMRLGAKPTHSKEELKDIFEKNTGRIRLFLCRQGETEIAGVVVFMLNDRVASSFYICEHADYAKFCGPSVLIAHIASQLTEEGRMFFDLGPSASESHVNAGVVFFKEGLGARAFCRDTWRWEVA